MDANRFAEYIGHFNARRYDDLVTFFRDDGELELPSRVLRGPRAIADHYRWLHGYVDESLRVEWFVSDANHIAIELYVRFACIRDLPEFAFRPLALGDVFAYTNLIHYDLIDDRFHRVRMAAYRVHEGAK